MLSNYFDQSKPKTLGLQITLDHYFSEIQKEYELKRQDQEAFRLTLSTNLPPGRGRQWANMPALLRYTDRYRNRTYYRLQPLMNLRPTYFFTLTFPNNAESKDEYDHMWNTYKSSWKKVTSWLRKYLPGHQIFRTFELTKKNALHVHAIMFSKSLPGIIEKFARYYHNNHGFIDLKQFHFYNQYIQTNKYWIEKEPEKDHWSMFDVREVTDPDRYTVVTNYVMKYQLKDVSTLHQAIFTKYRCRTYSTTRSLAEHIRTIKPTGDWSLVHKDYSGQDEPTEYIRATIPKPRLRYSSAKRRPSVLEILFRKKLPKRNGSPSRNFQLFQSSFDLLDRTRKWKNAQN